MDTLFETVVLFQLEGFEDAADWEKIMAEAAPDYIPPRGEMLGSLTLITLTVNTDLSFNVNQVISRNNIKPFIFYVSLFFWRWPAATVIKQFSSSHPSR